MPVAVQQVARCDEADRTGVQSPSGILATLTVANQIVTVARPTLGGLLVGMGGWHLIFALNVPLAVACLVLGTLRLPPGDAVPSGIRTDVLGMVLFAGSLTALMLFLMEPAAGRWYLPAIGAAAGAVFARRELAVTHPFIDLRVLGGNLPLLATYVRQFLAYTVTYTFLYGYSQWLQDGRGIDATLAGLLQLPMALAAIAITVPTGRHARVRGKLLAGSLIQLAGCGSLLLLTSDSPAWMLLVVATVFGVPHGLNGLANQNALYVQADPERIGASAGLLRTSTYFGALLSSAATAAFFQDGATTVGLHGLAWPMIGVAALFLVASITDRSLRNVGRDT